ncbi:MAG: PDZ domain-containing protein [Bacteroidetes bacterium]|nr:PDZ domain-containing protein [Bacteroidota bacterium]
MKYKISAPDPVSHYIEIEMVVEDVNQEEIFFQLPSWRPGRYELGNFAKNIQRWQAFDQQENPLPFKKVTKDCWKVKTPGEGSVLIRYNYFASQLDAGGCWLDEDQLYINPIHCCLYVEERIHENCFVEFVLPSNYRIATSLIKLKDRVFKAHDYHALVDSPVIASASLHHNSYSVNDINFHIWFQGNCKPDWERILTDFRNFTVEQIETMGTFPADEYHFLVQVLPGKFYHGVEHLASTVLAIGPEYKLMSESLYADFTGLASHELFHSWNVKTIRPAEMMPYDYSQENYSRLGFVYEGVTTYYGDLFLVRSGVYSPEQFLEEISQRVQKHFDNYGRFNLSVADSSFDTWLDGYVKGVPHRKTSIYDEGCLIALMTDLMIRRKTSGIHSLDDVLRSLYNDFGKKKTGYTEHDYISVIENIMGESVADFFIDYVYGTDSYEKFLSEMLHLAGCDLFKRVSSEYYESRFGFKTETETGITKVSAVAPFSIAARAGIGQGDEIAAVNEIKVESNLDELCRYFSDEKIVLTVFTPGKKLKDIALAPGSETFFHKYKIVKHLDALPEQKQFFRKWLKSDF